MSTEENKEVVRRYIEMVNERDYSHLNEVMHENFSGRPGQESLNGIEERKQLNEYLASIFPNMRNELNELIAEGDKVVAYTTFTAKHTGVDFYGHPASGKTGQFDIIAIYTLKDGKLLSGRVVQDQLSGFQQLGFYPPLPEE